MRQHIYFEDDDHDSGQQHEVTSISGKEQYGCLNDGSSSIPQVASNVAPTGIAGSAPGWALPAARATLECGAALAASAQHAAPRGGSPPASGREAGVDRSAPGWAAPAAVATPHQRCATLAASAQHAAPPGGSLAASWPGCPFKSAQARTARLGFGQPMGSRPPKEKCHADLSTEAPEWLPWNARIEERTEPVTGGPLADMASKATGQPPLAKARALSRRGQPSRGIAQRRRIGEAPTEGSSLRNEPQNARRVGSLRRLDPSAEGIPQWTCKQLRSKKRRPADGGQTEMPRRSKRLMLAGAKDPTSAGTSADSASEMTDCGPPSSWGPRDQHPCRRGASNKLQPSPNAGSCRPASAVNGMDDDSLGGSGPGESRARSMHQQPAVGQPSTSNRRSEQPCARAAQPNASGAHSDGKQDGNGNSSNISDAPRQAPRRLRRKLPKWLQRIGVDVWQYENLVAEAQKPDAPWISVKTGLVVVDASGDIKLMYLRKIVTAREARRIGRLLGSLLDRLVALGRNLKRGHKKNLPRGDGTIAKMVQVGYVAARNDPNTILRTIAERMDERIKLDADKVIGAIVRAIRKECPWAFTGLTDWQRAFCAMVENTSVSIATISADYQSPPHTDGKDVCLNALMSGVAWFARGEGLMPKGGWFRFDDLKLRLETCNGSAVLFDSTKMLHSTEECEPAEGGQAQRMGVSLQCRKPVLAVANRDIPGVAKSVEDVYCGRVQKTRIEKGQTTPECDIRSTIRKWMIV